MRIVIDGRMISNTGIGRWLQSIAAALVRLQSDHSIAILVNRSSEHLRRFVFNTQNLRLTSPIYSLREQVLLPIELLRYSPDVVHYPNFNVPILDRTTTVLTLCDLIYYLSRDACPSWAAHQYARFMIKRAARKARKIVTISQFSKEQIVSHLKYNENDVTVAYPAIDASLFHSPDEHTVAATITKYNVTRPYVFYTGNHEPRKNLARLMSAYRRLPQRCEYQLVIGGRIDPRRAEFYRSVEDLRSAGDVVFTGEIPEAELPAIYAGASLFVFPSTQEGFGLPPLEAMATGTPVVCSNSTSLPEVVGDAAIMFKATDMDELAAAMARVLTDSQLADQLRQRGFLQVRRFSWDAAARQIIRVYEEAAA